jgi:hypothetical protein
MRASIFPRALRVARQHTSGVRYGACLGLLIASLLAQAASANSTPRYSLSISEGVTTLPEFSVENTSANGPNEKQEVVIKIFHEGTEVARSKGEGGAWTSKVPAVGDTVTLESPAGTTIDSIQYDGLPSIDPTVCVGSANFSGQRSEGEEVTGGYFSLREHTDPYGHTSEERTGSSGHAQVTTLSGKAYSGNFLTTLSAGQTVFANETVKSSAPDGAIFEYSSENERPVGACPAVPAPIPLPAPIVPPKLQGTILTLVKSTIVKLLKFGFSDQVSINQPGTVTQDLYLQGGTLPALAASVGKHKRHKPPPALLLARGTATAAGAGDVTVHLKLTVRGRRRLKTSKKVKAVLITTLHTAGGQILSLGRRSVSFRR